jgi:hypothetical protein
MERNFFVDTSARQFWLLDMKECFTLRHVTSFVTSLLYFDPRYVICRVTDPMNVTHH